MKFALTLLISLFALSLRAQMPPRDSLIGKWICKDATLNELEVKTKEEWQGAMKMQDVFVSSVFEFNANGLFKLTFQNTASPFVKQLSFLNNRKWIVDEALRVIHIGEPNENIADIQVSVKGGDVYFVLVDMPMKLHVVKKK